MTKCSLLPSAMPSKGDFSHVPSAKTDQHPVPAHADRSAFANSPLSLSFHDDTDRLILGDMNASFNTRSLPTSRTERTNLWEIGRVYSLIGNTLSFTAHNDDEETKREIREHPARFYFSTDLQERYFPFCADFGPVDIANVVHFCRYMREKLEDPRLQNRECVYYCSSDSECVSNAAFLLAAYLMIDHGRSPEDAVKPFESILNSPILPFRDATYSPSTFPLTITDCLRGLEKAMRLEWFDLDTFNCEDYEDLASPEIGGDMHTLCPKFVAFRGPEACGGGAPKDIACARTPESILPVLAALEVGLVVRLNDAHTYSAAAFEEAGIQHADLFFADCTTPTDAHVTRFFALCEAQRGVVAVHCLAGLGRTGTMIGLWLMSKHGFTAREAIAWMRIVRPGCVIGPQQHYLEWMEKRLRAGTFPCSASRADGGSPSDSTSMMRFSASSEAVPEQLALQVREALVLRDAEREEQARLPCARR